MFRSAFEKTLDWIAPRVEEPQLQQPAQAPAPPQPPPEKSWQEQLRELAEYHRSIGYSRPERDSDNDRNSPLYERYKAERESAWQARQEAEQKVYDRFDAYAKDLRGFYDMRFEQEKHSGMPGHVRHNAMELLGAQRRGDRVEMLMLRDQQIAEARRATPLPDWGGWLKREAAKGDRDAARALERHEAREAERNRDRDDDGRGIEP